MKIFIDFENALLNNSLKLEKLFASLGQFGRSCYADRVVLHRLPYESKTISILTENYNHPENEVFLLFKKESFAYVDQAKEFLTEEFKFKCQGLEVEYDKLETIQNHCDQEDFAFIGGSIRDYKIFKNAKESSLVGNLMSYCAHYMIANEDKDSRSTFCAGFFDIFFTHIQIITPIFAMWPAWMELDEKILNLTKLKAILISSIGYFSFMSLLRTLLSIDFERNYFFQDKEIFSGEEFILYGAKLELGIFWLCVFYFIGSYGMYLNFLGGCIGAGFSLIYFCFKHSKTSTKWFYLLSTMFVTNLIFNPMFAKKFLLGV